MLTRNENRMKVYDPFHEIEEMGRNFFAPYGFFGNTRDGGLFRTDIRDMGDSYSLDAELPGFEKSDITLELNDDILTVHAEHKEQNDGDGESGRYLCRERSFASYERRFDLNGVDRDKISAKYENGILHLDLPKESKTVPETRRLTIQ